MSETVMFLSVGAAYVMTGLALLGFSLGSFESKLKLEPVRVRSRRK